MAVATPSSTPQIVVGQLFYDVIGAGEPWSITFPSSGQVRLELRPGDTWPGDLPYKYDRDQIWGTNNFVSGLQVNATFTFQIEPGNVNDAAWLILLGLHQTEPLATVNANPPFVLAMSGEVLYIVGYTGGVGTPVNNSTAYQTLWTDNAPIQRGQIYLMQISATFDPVNGFLSVIRNGVSLVSYKGPLGWGPNMGETFWQFGLERAAGATNTMVVDFYNISVFTGAVAQPESVVSSTPATITAAVPATAKSYLIPITPKSQKFGIILAGVAYNMTLTWRNTPADIQPPGWFLDINDVSNNPIIQGIPLVTGANLLEQDAYLQLGFQLYVQSDGDPNTMPTYETLGVSCKLYALY